MYHGKRVALIIPARNEASALPHVLGAIPSLVDLTLVVDNGSTDETAPVAREWGAEVVSEPRAGYGRACLAGLSTLGVNPPDIVAFADADGSDDISRLPQLLDFIVKEQAQLCLAARIPIEPHALTPQQRFGNRLATQLIYLFWGHRYGDLGPMRAITWEGLGQLGMSAPNYAWTIEMQVRALQKGLRVKELATLYHKRKAGRSKVSGTLAGSCQAGAKILWFLARAVLAEKMPLLNAKRTRQAA
ncbi:MAG: glycosyltransferase family 2 protein [Syntrophobacter sp.]